MDKIIPEFIHLLIKENEAVDKLLGMSEEKQRVIILGKVQELDKIVQKEAAIVANLDKLEGARFKLQEKMASYWGIKVEELIAAVIIEKTQELLPAFQQELTQEIMHLEASISRLQLINKENNDLIGMSLEYIDTIKTMINGDGAGTYSDQGMQADESANRPAKRLLDKKI